MCYSKKEVFMPVVLDRSVDFDTPLESEESYDQYVVRELEKADAEAADPQTRRYTHAEVMTHISQKYGI
jgi:hypothetical protein